MADLTDVTAFLTQAVAKAVYPNGTAQPSVSGTDVRIFEGWPQADQLDLDMAGKMLVNGLPQARPNGPCAEVSIYPMPGTTAEPYQVLDKTYIIVNPNYGLSFSVAGNVITVTGTPVPSEYLTILLFVGSKQPKVISSNQTTLPAILNDLVSQAASLGFTITTDGVSTLTMPANLWSFTVRQGSVGTLGKVTHRQRNGVMISVWAPTYKIRTALAAAIDNVLKQTIIVAMPDTSQCKICYSHTTQTDTYQLQTVYRRDLVFDAEYATVWEFPGYVITSLEVDITKIVDHADFANPPTIPAVQ